MDKILQFLEDIRTGLANATSTIMQFIHSVGDLFQTLLVWLPTEIRVVLYAVIIIGLVFGLFIK